MSLMDLKRQKLCDLLGITLVAASGRSMNDLEAAVYGGSGSLNDRRRAYYCTELGTTLAAQSGVSINTLERLFYVAKGASGTNLTDLAVSYWGLPAGFSPSDIAGLVAWYAADQLALADDAAVASWTDLSGNDTHAVQATGASQPTYKTAILNSLPVVRFDGTDDLLRTAAITLIPQPTTWFCVGKRDAVDGNNRYFFDTRAVNGQLLGGQFFYRIYAGGAGYVTGQVIDTSFHIYQATFNGASSDIRVEGGVATTGDPGSTGVNGITIGASGGDTELLDGDLAEIILYDSALSTSDLNSVGEYLADKYALTWTAI